MAFMPTPCHLASLLASYIIYVNALRAHPGVLELRLQIYWTAKKWEACVEIASALVKLNPGGDHGWIGRSFALHELKRTQEAYDFLLPADNEFLKNWTIPYNLACYCAQLNRLEEAQIWFKKAMSINENTVNREAIDDPDLKTVGELEKTGKKDLQSCGTGR
jgi:tetratricopeptide (TPR) repeat protein